MHFDGMAGTTCHWDQIGSYVILEKTGMTRGLLFAKVLSPLGKKDNEIDGPIVGCDDPESEFPQVEPTFYGLHLTALQMAKLGMLSCWDQ